MNRLYIITPDWTNTSKLLATTEQALLGGATIVQYRNKLASAQLRREQARHLRALCLQYNRPLIINDHIDLCLEVDADGVHVGGMDTPIEMVRSLIGQTKIVGATCYGSLALAERAYKAGASYIAFGGFYPSTVKKYPVTTSFDLVATAKKTLPLPIVAIGGITQDNAVRLIKEGADAIAVISSVYLADRPRIAAENLAALF